MKAELWHKIDELFAAAQAQPAEERAAFLDGACGGDPELRAELESLLKAAASDKSFLEHPPAPPPEQPALKAGDKLGVFEIVERIGRGGMGEVYRAHDPRLTRDVAIKVLPPDFAQDAERRRRFEHEARAASALSHPNIVSVFDVGSTGGISWMVTELVEGRSLREALAKGAMPPRKAVEIAAQIAEGLAAAHAAGLVHRDLKAENVMLAPGDLVKILDFGIAKRRFRDAATGTFTDTLTRTGEVIGTVTSMSPEQVEGKEVDHRSDIFSLGVLLYEMLSGRRPFTGDTHAAVMNAIVNQEPEDLPAAVPEAIATIVRRCLEKLPERRFQSAADLGFALREAVAAQPRVAGHRKRNRRPVMAAAVAGIVLAAAGAAYWWLRPAEYPMDLRPVPLTSLPDEEYYPSFSPDGNKVALTWMGDKGETNQGLPNFDIYVKQVGSGGPPLRLTTDPAIDTIPAWSPDDRYIAFVRNSGKGASTLLLVPPLGGPERTVATLPAGGFYLDWPFGIAWTPDSKWLAVPMGDSALSTQAIWLLSVDTGESHRLTKPLPGTRGDCCPAFSPDGRMLAFGRELREYTQAPYALALSRGFQPHGEPRELTKERYSSVNGIAWTSDGRSIVYSGGGGGGGHLFRLPVSGRGAPALLPYATGEVRFPVVALARPRLAYQWSLNVANLWRQDIRTGERKVLVGSGNFVNQLPQYSPGGRKLVFQSNRSEEEEMWTCDADGSNCARLAGLGKTVGGTPRWSPDSRWIAFDSGAEGQFEIYVIQADGGGRRRMTYDPANDITPSWSRDGRWIYFASNRSGRYETWKMPAAGGAAQQVTRGGGSSAFESADGKYLYFLKGLDAGPLFRMPASGGEAMQVVPYVAGASSFEVTAKAIYFWYHDTTPDTPDAVQRLEFSSGKITEVLRPSRAALMHLTVSPDDAFVVWPQYDRCGAQLMLVEGFR